MNNSVVCPNCNYANQLGATVCSNCGGSLEINQVTRLVQEYATTGHLGLERKKSFWGGAMTLKITVAGADYVLKNGDKLDLDLAPGIYPVTYKSLWHKLKKVDVSITSAGKFNLYFVPGLMFGAIKLDMKKSKIQ